MRYMKIMQSIDKEKVHITFDLETLGANYNAPIVQIGAVAFKESGEILDKFSSSVDLETLDKHGFKMDYSTVNFWLQQSKEAIGSVFAIDNDIYYTLRSFCDWAFDQGSEDIWSHSTFDPVILANAYTKLELRNPFTYRQHRDIRTLEMLVPTEKPERKGTHHNALDDCIYQAEYISKMLRQLSPQ